MAGESNKRDGFWMTAEFPRDQADWSLLDGWSIADLHRVVHPSGRTAFRCRLMPGGDWCQFAVIEDPPGNRPTASLTDPT
jgi:hypothetical protein